ncbi:RNA polymerase sigma factor [Streptomyces aureus]|uniref:RNA polymerase sigma factor n=1 Tax=Streptomyces aureus TaxID=193461 RepID=UPI00367A2EBA
MKAFQSIVTSLPGHVVAHPATTGLVLCLLVALKVVRSLLVEWQRRVTLTQLVRFAPAGSVIHQKRGHGGPAMEVQVGASPDAEQGENGVTEQSRASEELVAALWDREAAGLTRFAMVRTGGDLTAAEDLVQITFMAAVQHWSRLADAGAEGQRRWLRRVCHHKWVDSVRSDTRRDRAYVDVERLEVRLSSDPADAVLARADLERCWQVIQNFPPRRRQIALLYFVELKSELWIAEMLDLQPSGVRKHVAKARQQLHEVLDGISAVDPNEAITLNAGEEE